MKRYNKISFNYVFSIALSLTILLLLLIPAFASETRADEPCKEIVGFSTKFSNIEIDNNRKISIEIIDENFSADKVYRVNVYYNNNLIFDSFGFGKNVFEFTQPISQVKDAKYLVHAIVSNKYQVLNQTTTWEYPVIQNVRYFESSDVEKFYKDYYKDFSGDIPVIECYRDDDNEKPIVFFQHWLGGDKESTLQILQRFAQEGYYAVCLDSYAHGERSGVNLEPLSCVEIAIRTAREMDVILSAYSKFKQNEPQNWHNINTTDFAYSGISMGGMAAFYAAGFPVEGRIPSAIISLASTPLYTSISDGVKYTYLPNLNDGISDKQKDELNDFLNNASPLYNKTAVNNLRNVDILLLHGDADGVVSIDGVTKLYDDLKTSTNKTIKFDITQGLGHGSTPEQLNLMVDFLNSVFKK